MLGFVAKKFHLLKKVTGFNIKFYKPFRIFCPKFRISGMKLPKTILPKRIIFMVKAEALVENINKNSEKNQKLSRNFEKAFICPKCGVVKETSSFD